MPAPSLAILYAFESQFIAAARAVLDSLGLPNVSRATASEAVASGATAALADTRTVVRFEVGLSTGDTWVPALMSQMPAVYQGVLTVQLYRRRDENAPADMEELISQLDPAVGLLRATFTPYLRPFTEETLPWLSVVSITPQANAFGVDEKREQDIATLSWQVGFEIRETAWPTS